jgi:hypothetical protein
MVHTGDLGFPVGQQFWIPWLTRRKMELVGRQVGLGVREAHGHDGGRRSLAPTILVSPGGHSLMA